MNGACAEIELAAPDDEAALRALLRDQPLPGWVTLSFEREPDYFAAARFEGERHQVLVARAPSATGGVRAPVAVCARSVHRVFVNGQVRRLGYVSQFRAVPEWQRGFRAYRLLRDGFAEVDRLLRRSDELPYDITSILSDNRAAQRMLCARLRDMPVYERLSGFETIVYRSGSRPWRAGSEVETGRAEDLPGIAECLQRNYRRFQFAPVWDESALTAAGLSGEDFLLLRSSGRVSACVAIWDQRAAKQMVVRAYRTPIGRLRPLVNLVAPVFGLPRLPPTGCTLRQAWLSHLACDDDAADALLTLLPAALARARGRGLDQLMLGLADNHPLLATARGARRHLAYRSDIYRVHWGSRQAGGDGHGGGPGSRPLLLEAATL